MLQRFCASVSEMVGHGAGFKVKVGRVERVERVERIIVYDDLGPWAYTANWGHGHSFRRAGRGRQLLGPLALERTLRRK